jgi:hypothetical protein
MPQHVHECHWSVPTLLMPPPYWYAAWDDAWSCWNDRDIRILHSTEVCQRCPLFRKREAGREKTQAIPPRGAIRLDLIS